MIRMMAFCLSAGALILVPATRVGAQQTVQLPARDRVLTERPVPLFSIGREEGEDWELLAGVRQVAFDRHENLYVLDSGNQRVLVFDPNGRFLRQIGKKGEGPGELMSPLGLTVTTADEVVVSDLGRQAWSIFTTDGSFVRNVTLDASDFGAFASPLYTHPLGIVTRQRPMFAMARNVERGGAAFTPPGGPERMQITLTDLKTAERSTLWEVTLPELPTKVDRQGSGSQMSFRVVRSSPEFMPQVLSGVVPGGSIAVASEAAYRIRITSNGKVQRVIERPIAPVKVGRREQDLARERQRARLTSGGRAGGLAIAVRAEGGQRTVATTAPPPLTPAQIEEQLANLQFMDQVPVLSGMTADPLGRLWVQRTAEDLGEEGPIDILTYEGGYIGTIPKGRVPAAISAGGRAAWIERNDLGVERVLVRRLPATWR